MTFGESIKTCFSKYVTFSGRASRSEYWWFCLLNFLVNLPFNAWSYYLPFYADDATLFTNSLILFGLSTFAIVLVLPMLSVFVRRLHDTGRSGWNFFWGFLPIIGAIILFVYLLQPSGEDNKYGVSPDNIPEEDQLNY